MKNGYQLLAIAVLCFATNFTAAQDGKTTTTDLGKLYVDTNEVSLACTKVDDGWERRTTHMTKAELDQRTTRVKQTGGIAGALEVHVTDAIQGWEIVKTTDLGNGDFVVTERKKKDGGSGDGSGDQPKKPPKKGAATVKMFGIAEVKEPDLLVKIKDMKFSQTPELSGDPDLAKQAAGQLKNELCVVEKALVGNVTVKLTEHEFYQLREPGATVKKVFPFALCGESKSLEVTVAHKQKTINIPLGEDTKFESGSCPLTDDAKRP